uniref:Uncharacterized protein n=1 Tax=Populus alba TaxID=43335 RepID=A0A4U5Q0S0_POPAL|nr:hypothetical protein D5086_0000171740 [Populus alba]
MLCLCFLEAAVYASRRAGIWRGGRRLWALSGGLWTSLLMAERSAAECPESGSGAAESRGRICGGGSSVGFCDGGRFCGAASPLLSVDGAEGREDRSVAEAERGLCGVRL